MTPPGAFLTLPYDIRAKVYSQVFTGSQIHLDLANGASENRLQSQDDPSSVLAYYGPEDYDLLLVCSQIRDEATPILVSSLRLCLSHPQVHRRFSIDFFQLTGDSKAPALLRQAIPSTKYIDFVSDYASRLKSDLRAFPKLRELRLHGQFELSASLNDTKIDNDPMVLLDKDHGGAFLQSLIDGPMNYTMATPGSYLDPAMKRSREYKSIWKGCVSFKKFTDERPKHPDRMTVVRCSSVYYNASTNQSTAL
jgi:hypothetical protein